MSLAVYGVQGTLDDAHWASLLQALGDGRAGMSVCSGLVVSAASGTRTVNVSPGRSVQAGAYFIAASGSTYTVALNANTATTSRYDIICVQVDWLAAESAYMAAGGDANPTAAGAAAKAAAGSLVAVSGVAGSSPRLPSLTQTEGTLWQTPLARVLVRPSVTTLLASDVRFLQPTRPDKTTHGWVTVSDGGSDPKTTTVNLPPYFFTSEPAVQLTPETGASSGTISNPSIVAGSVTKDSFQVTINRSTTTSVLLHWTASGL